MKYWILQKKYRNNSFDKEFDWNWEEIHFNRIALVNLLVGNTHDCAYLEIGCASNALFDSIPVLNKVGVDPQDGGNIRKTSDEFFYTNKSLFDVVFIDGLHTYDQVRRDVINSIKFLKPGGWIALHDMLPRTWIEDHVPIVSSEAWTGDVWKVAFELSKTEGIDFKIIKIDNGVGVLRLTDNTSSLVDLANELNDKRFSYFYENIAKLPIVEWNDCQNWLRNS
ncbi:MAG: class I SAM-dependent methyltransferase [Methylocella sp.]